MQLFILTNLIKYSCREIVTNKLKLLSVYLVKKCIYDFKLI
jgi:hypothetical protein